MNKISKGEFLRLLQMFCVTFVWTTLACVIITKVFYPLRDTNFYILFYIPFFTSIGFSLGYWQRYKKYTTKIIYDGPTDKDMIFKLQKIMKKMHWSIKKNDNEQMIFKSSVFITLLIEHLSVTINKSDLRLEGPEYYVKKVVNKLNS